MGRWCAFKMGRAVSWNEKKSSGEVVADMCARTRALELECQALLASIGELKDDVAGLHASVDQLQQHNATAVRLATPEAVRALQASDLPAFVQAFFIGMLPP